jgi:hypothetical protein
MIILKNHFENHAVGQTSEPTVLADYRPISILPALSKAFEIIINRQITQYASVNHELLCSNLSHQYGFTTCAVNRIKSYLSNVLAQMDQHHRFCWLQRKLCRKRYWDHCCFRFLSTISSHKFPSANIIRMRTTCNCT